jgi:signal transduction histidine kinase
MASNPVEQGRPRNTGKEGSPRVAVRARFLTLGAAIAGAAITLIVTVLPTVQFAYRNESLHIALDTAGGVVAGIASLLLVGRVRQSELVRDAAAALALGIFGLTNLFLSALPSALGAGEEPFWTWATLACRLIGAVLFAASSLAGSRRFEPPDHLGAKVVGACAAVVGVVCALVAAVGPALPQGIETLAPEASGRPRILGHPGVLGSQLLAMALFAVAAWGFTSRADTTHDPLLRWLGAASALAAFARLNYFLFPSIYSQYVYTGDILRLGYYVLLAVGAVREIGTYWRAREQAAVLEERRRMARDLHDGLAQELAFVVAWTRRAARRPDQPFPSDMVTAAAQRALDESRRAIAALSQPIDQTLSEAIAQIADEVAHRENSKIHVELKPHVDVTPRAREELLRIVREALTNACRHARAQEIRVSLANGERVRVAVTDDGIGFDPSEERPGFGVLSMRERAQSLGAEIRIDSDPGMGTRVEILL